MIQLYIYKYTTKGGGGYCVYSIYWRVPLSLWIKLSEEDTAKCLPPVWKILYSGARHPDSQFRLDW